MDYHENQKKGVVADTEDDNGTIDIPGSTYFYFMLHDNGIFVTAARRNDLSRTVDHINLA